MEAADSSETFVTTRRHIPELSNVDIYHYKNLWHHEDVLTGVA